MYISITQMSHANKDKAMIAEIKPLLDTGIAVEDTTKK